MGFRYYRRINLGRGLGLNVNKSGISPSYRTNYGSIGPKAFSIRTGIPGLTYKGGRGKAGEVAVLALLAMLTFMVIAAAAVVLWNVARFIGWALVEAYHFCLRKMMEREARNKLRDGGQDSEHTGAT